MNSLTRDPRVASGQPILYVDYLVRRGLGVGLNHKDRKARVAQKIANAQRKMMED